MQYTAEYMPFPGEVIILGLPAFVKMLKFKEHPKGCQTNFYKTSPVTKIHSNGDFETKNGFLCKRT